MRAEKTSKKNIFDLMRSFLLLIENVGILLTNNAAIRITKYGVIIFKLYCVSKLESS